MYARTHVLHMESICRKSEVKSYHVKIHKSKPLNGCVIHVVFICSICEPHMQFMCDICGIYVMFMYKIYEVICAVYM